MPGIEESGWDESSSGAEEDAVDSSARKGDSEEADFFASTVFSTIDEEEDFYVEVLLLFLERGGRLKKEDLLPFLFCWREELELGPLGQDGRHGIHILYRKQIIASQYYYY